MFRPERNINNISILVIEDNPGDFILIEDYLLDRFKNIKLYHCEDAASTIAFLAENNHQIDLIFLDLHLPDLSGLELIDKILGVIFITPIIILTGYGDIALARKSLELGIYDFLIKDELDPNLLQKSIEFAISRSSHVRQIEIQNQKLRNIAWMQSHGVRAPLSRMLGIMNLIESETLDKNELSEWLKHMRTSANELDEIIKSIVKDTQILNKKDNE
ncbi:response regulator [Algoriphagus yeomjeoni]|uniref:histidine kinase n=1 Tax=Algoriphagus yeomjeoni TaxID=291403 RepID=A0A327P1R6_9BACT|nr:response regulator [Algoriphagus yeomjeoni]RAI85643.1 response regulator receiver domain-containing protein [Algoriphagus yeomjeoni]